jgi:enoyl-CoA hydratase/carnithine racemase
MLSLKQVFDKVNAQEDPSIGLIKDGTIFYLVFNKDENTFTNDVLDKLHRLLDVVENSEGAACLVTIGTGSRFYSTGFNLGFWAADFKNMVTSMSNFQRLFARMLTLNVPSLAVINGHAYAGGLLFAISHDFRIM